MGDHFFLLMYATSGEERNVTRFTSYRRVEDAVAMVKEWLEKAAAWTVTRRRRRRPCGRQRRPTAGDGFPVPGGPRAGGPGQVQWFL